MAQLPEGALGGSALGSYTAVIAVDSLQRALERNCAERAGAQVRPGRGLLSASGDGSNRQAAVTASFLNEWQHRSSEEKWAPDGEIGAGGFLLG